MGQQQGPTIGLVRVDMLASRDVARGLADDLAVLAHVLTQGDAAQRELVAGGHGLAGRQAIAQRLPAVIATRATATSSAGQAQQSDSIDMEHLFHHGPVLARCAKRAGTGRAAKVHQRRVSGRRRWRVGFKSLLVPQQPKSRFSGSRR